MADNSLTTLATAKLVLGIADTDSDALLSLYIDSASDMIATFLNRKLEKATYVERQRSDGHNRLAVKQTPVESITSIFWDDSEISSDNYYLEDANAGLVFSSHGWPYAGVRRPKSPSLTALAGLELPETIITYVGGWVTPGQDETGSGSIYEGTGVTLPAIIEQAALETVTGLYNSRGESGSINKEKIGDAEVSYEEERGRDPLRFDSGLSQSVRGKLLPYRRSERIL